MGLFTRRIDNATAAKARNALKNETDISWSFDEKSKTYYCIAEKTTPAVVHPDDAPAGPKVLRSLENLGITPTITEELSEGRAQRIRLSIDAATVMNRLNMLERHPKQRMEPTMNTGWVDTVIESRSGHNLPDVIEH